MSSTNVNYLALLQRMYLDSRDFNSVWLHYAVDAPFPLYNSGIQSCMLEDRFDKIVIGGSIGVGDSIHPGSGGALQFLPNNFQTIMTKTLQNFIGTQITIEAWIKPNCTICGIALWNQMFGLYLDNTGAPVMEITVNSISKASKGPILPLNKWVHVLGLGDSTNGIVSLYINGSQVSNATFAPGNITNSRKNFLIGGLQYVAVGYYVGEMADVRVYNRTLSSSEIHSRFSTNTQINDGLVGSWALPNTSSDIEAGQIPDLSFNGNSMAISFTELTSTAYGDSGSANTFYNITFGTVVGSCLYIGDPWKFYQVYFNLTVFADPTWNAIWEYSIGTSWASLYPTDGTNNMRKSGIISFTPPSNWTLKYVDNWPLYWLRLRTVSIGQTQPIAQTYVQFVHQYEIRVSPAIHCTKYNTTVSNSNTYLVIPGWDATNDKNHDGFIDNNEFSSLANPSATARLEYISRAPSAYLTNRWSTNFHNAYLRAFIANFTSTYYYENDGIFVDNENPIIVDCLLATVPFLEYANQSNPNIQFLIDNSLVVQGIKSLIPTRPVNINGPSVTMAQYADSELWETWLYFQSSPKFNADYMSFAARSLNFLDNLQVAIYIHGNPRAGYFPSDIDPDRYAMYCLSMYYILAQKNTYFSYADIDNYYFPFDLWFDAIGYDVGEPTSDWYILDRRLLDHPPNTINLLVNSDFETITGNLLSNWTCITNHGSVNCSYVLDSYSGKYAAFITCSTLSNGGLTQYLTLQPNTSYTVSGWVKVISYSGVPDWNLVARILVFYGTGHAQAYSIGGALNSWVLISLWFTTPASVSNSFVAVQINNAIGTMLFDNMTLEVGAYNLDHTYGRNYSNAVVLSRILNQGLNYNTSLEFNLGDSYYPLQANGTLGSKSSLVSLRNFDAAILIKQPVQISSTSSCKFLECCSNPQAQLQTSSTISNNRTQISSSTTQTGGIFQLASSSHKSSLIIGISLGVGVPVVLLILGIAAFLVYKKRKPNEPPLNNIELTPPFGTVPSHL